MEANGTVSVLTVQPALDELGRRGVDLDPVLAAAHLSPEALRSVDNRLPYPNMRELWQEAASATHDRYFGTHVAAGLPKGGYDIFDYIFASATTVQDAMARLLQYVRIIYDHSNTCLLIEPLHARVVRRFPLSAPQFDEFSITLLVVRSRQASGVDWTPERIRFQHDGSDDGGELARLFRCPITFDEGETELCFAPDVLQLPNLHSDSRLLAILLRYADSLLAHLPPQGDLVATISAAIARQIATSLPTLGATAESVQLPERTLQRRLAANGVSHSTLVDRVRRDLALKYVGDAGRNISDIAYLLHFSDSTAFHRAFKRWTGGGPMQYRRTLFRGAS